MTNKTIIELIDDYAEARHVGGCHTSNAKTSAARAAVMEALSAAQAGVQAGYVMVPLEPTVHQEAAGRDASYRCSTLGEACKIYKAMLAAAPQPSPSPAPAGLTELLQNILSSSCAVESETSLSNEHYARLHAALASMSTAPAQPGQEGERDYPPLPDFDAVEQHIYGACRRYIDRDMLEPIHNLIRDCIDADRASRAAPQPATADAVDALPDEKTCVDYVLQYGGRRRDCADENGVCPGSGLPCEGARKAVTHVVQALRYGLQHGYLRAAQREVKL